MSAAAVAPERAPDRRRTPLRPDIQALRAVAVAVVVVFHVAPAALPGGYIGVDVFFVISGFLITRHLLRELDASGTVDVPRFWARRARRLLPASLLVLGVTAVATLVLVPYAWWPQYFHEIGASALYVQNWALAQDSVDYLAATNEPSPVQHYWSLSAEEQFYLVWPLLIVLAAVLLRRRPRRAVVAVLAVLTAASLVTSIIWTSVASSSAYFVTPTRAWEFGAGALLAAAPPLLERAGDRMRIAVSYAGWGLIVVAAVVYTGATPFPGIAALLPVAGTLAVIAAGVVDRDPGVARVAALQPVQWLGGVSYSVYLWHFPVVVFAERLTGPIGPLTGAIAVALTLVLAALSKRYVEDVFQHWRPFAQGPSWRTLAATVAGMAVVLALAGAGGAVADDRTRAADARSASVEARFADCLGALAATAPDSCADDPALDDVVVPEPDAPANDGEFACDQRTVLPNLSLCDLNPDVDDPTATVALIGDSHARQYRAPLAAAAEQLGWKAYNLSNRGCLFVDGVRDVYEPLRSQCITWQESVTTWLDEHPEVDYVVLAALATSDIERPAGSSRLDALEAGYHARWSGLPDNVRGVFVVRDNPLTDQETLDCVRRAYTGGGDYTGCARDRELALPDDPQAIAARSAADAGVPVPVRLIDFSDASCDDDVCRPVVGHVLVNRDATHLTDAWVATLRQRMADALRSGADAAG